MSSQNEWRYVCEGKENWRVEEEKIVNKVIFYEVI